MRKSNKQRGFTIIEVVLVLAIAGLIFLVVFLALPALQKSQRDTARRQDVGMLVSSLQNYLSDNNAVPVAASSAAFASYYGSLAQTTSLLWGASASATNSTAAIDTTKDCSGAAITGSRNASVSIKLESGGVYCKSV